MWVEKTKNGKFKFAEQVKSPYTNKHIRAAVTMERNTNSTRKQAELILHKKLEEKLQGSTSNIVKHNITLQQLVDEYGRLYAMKNKPSTYREWLTYHRKNILKTFDPDTLVEKIDSRFVRNKLEGLALQGDMSRNKIKNININICSLMRYAHEKGYTNLEVKGTMPKIRKKEATKTADKYLEDTEIKALFTVIEKRKPQYKLILEWQYQTGMRIGEVLALKVNDVFQKNGGWYVRIDKTLDYSQRKKSEYTISDSPKTESSRRIIAISSRAVEIYQQCKIGKKPNDLLLNENYTPQSISNYVRRYLRILGINKSGTHIFRHTHVAKLAELGVPIEAISKRLGHKSDKITREIYFHITKKAQRRYDAKLEELPKF